MSGGNYRGRRRKQSVFSALAEPTIHAGWSDVMEERGFRPEYETMDIVSQQRYELGRRCAAVWIGMEMPRMPGASPHEVDAFAHLDHLRVDDVQGCQNASRIAAMCGIESRI